MIYTCTYQRCIVYRALALYTLVLSATQIRGAPFLKALKSLNVYLRWLPYISRNFILKNALFTHFEIIGFFYSSVPNKRADPNKRAGWNFENN